MRGCQPAQPTVEKRNPEARDGCPPPRSPQKALLVFRPSEAWGDIKHVCAPWCQMVLLPGLAPSGLRSAKQSLQVVRATNCLAKAWEQAKLLFQ